MLGRCTCGEVQFKLASDPLIVHCCHCRWCQRETGSAFVLNAMIEADRVTLVSGTPAVVKLPSQSGKGQKVARCSTCQIALWSIYSGAGDLFRFVRVGTLEEPDKFPPGVHIYIMSKQPWITLPRDVPAFPEYYDRKKVWRPESLARREVMLAAARPRAG